jgi:hypothetical protein
MSLYLCRGFNGSITIPFLFHFLDGCSEMPDIYFAREKSQSLEATDAVAARPGRDF